MKYLKRILIMLILVTIIGRVVGIRGFLIQRKL